MYNSDEEAAKLAQQGDNDAVKLRFSGYKYKEIAKRLKLDEHKVKKALERGKYKLRKYLRRIYDEYT